MKKPMIAALIVAGALAVPMTARAQQRDTTKHEAVTPKNVAKNTGEEAERVGKRSSKAVAKGAKDTGKQAKRAAKGVKKAYSRKARQEAKGEKARKDSVKAATRP